MPDAAQRQVRGELHAPIACRCKADLLKGLARPARRRRSGTLSLSLLVGSEGSLGTTTAPRLGPTGTAVAGHRGVGTPTCLAGLYSNERT